MSSYCSNLRVPGDVGKQGAYDIDFQDASAYDNDFQAKGAYDIDFTDG